MFGDYYYAVTVKNSVNLGNVISSNTAYGIAGKVNKINNVVSLGTVNAPIAYTTWESFKGDQRQNVFVGVHVCPQNTSDITDTREGNLCADSEATLIEWDSTAQAYFTQNKDKEQRVDYLLNNEVRQQ